MKVQMESFLVGHLTVAHHVGGVAADVDGVAERLADIFLYLSTHNIVQATGFGHDSLPKAREWSFDGMRISAFRCPYMKGYQRTIRNT